THLRGEFATACSRVSPVDVAMRACPPDLVSYADPGARHSGARHGSPQLRLGVRTAPPSEAARHDLHGGIVTDHSGRVIAAHRHHYTWMRAPARMARPGGGCAHMGAWPKRLAAPCGRGVLPVQSAPLARAATHPSTVAPSALERHRSRARTR